MLTYTYKWKDTGKIETRSFSYHSWNEFYYKFWNAIEVINKDEE